jgi:hypothetical protein
MLKPLDLKGEPGKLRHLAARARWMAKGLSQKSDQERFARYADELEALADRIEAQRSASIESERQEAQPGQSEISE